MARNRIIPDFEVLSHGTEFFDTKTGKLLFTVPSRSYRLANAIWQVWFVWYRFCKLFRPRFH